MGKRRIRNLQSLGYTDLIGFDPREDRRNESRKKYRITTFSDLNKALRVNPDAMIISTPPDIHAKYAKIAIKNNIHFFMELNLFSKDVKKIIQWLKGKQIVAMPSCSMKFHPVVKEMKKLIDKNTIGKILSIHHHSGFFLPLWHPWENYKEFFASNKKMGGTRELVAVDLVWLTDLFSGVKSVYGNIKKISTLDVDIDDIYQMILEFKSGILCDFVTDVISNPPSKVTKLIGEKGTMICDFKEGIIKINKPTKFRNLQLRMGKIAKGYKGTTPPEILYEEETKNFVDALNGKKYSYSFEDELNILTILEAVETSSQRGKKIIL